MSPWGWQPERTQGIWRHGPVWFKPLAAVSPWACAVLALMTLYVVGDTLTLAKGTLFDLPDAVATEGAHTSLVAVVMPLHNETMIFFDDARYSLDDTSSLATFGQHLAERIDRAPQKTVLVLADRRISWDRLTRLACVARANGVTNILFAHRSTQEWEE